MLLYSELNPLNVEALIRSVKFASPEIIPDKLWEEGITNYFQGHYLSAIILGGTCAEAAHKSRCRTAGMVTRDVKWAKLIDDSVPPKVIIPCVAKVLHRIRINYRNNWVHVDLDEIASGYPIPSTAGRAIVTPSGETIIQTSYEEYQSIFATVTAQQEALNCLWLTGVTLSYFYGGYPPLFESSIHYAS